MKNLAEKLLLAGVIAALSVWWFRHHAANVPPVAVEKIPIKKKIDQPGLALAATQGVMPMLVLTNGELTNRLAGATNGVVQSDPMDDKIRLGQLWSSNDPAAVEKILPYLTNEDAEVRSMAIEAIKQVGNRSTVPLLEKMAAETKDEEQSAALTRAALFLTIPTQTEREGGSSVRGHAPSSAPISPPAAQ